MVSLVVANSLPLSVSNSTAKDFGSKHTFTSREPPFTGTSVPLDSTVGQRLAKPEPFTCA